MTVLQYEAPQTETDLIALNPMVPTNCFKKVPKGPIMGQIWAKEVILATFAS